jgi:hypothetical protein
MNEPPEGDVPKYVAARIRGGAPQNCNVLPGSTPVVAFGDPRSSPVATLGLNPSRIEFEEDGVELDGHLRRFETLRSLGSTASRTRLTMPSPECGVAATTTSMATLTGDGSTA